MVSEAQGRDPRTRNSGRFGSLLDSKIATVPGFGRIRVAILVLGVVSGKTGSRSFRQEFTPSAWRLLHAHRQVVIDGSVVVFCENKQLDMSLWPVESSLGVARQRVPHHSRGAGLKRSESFQDLYKSSATGYIYMHICICCCICIYACACSHPHEGPLPHGPLTVVCLARGSGQQRSRVGLL